MSEKKIIIEGSESWIKRVPDKYAIRCIERFNMPGKPNEYLGFAYVEPISRVYGAGFVQGYGIMELEPEVRAILIAQNDLTSPPSFYIKKKYGSIWADAGINDFELMGALNKINDDITQKVIENAKDDTVSFKRIVYYSGRRNERQKSDLHSPLWLKEFAEKNFANVVLFEF